MQSETGFPSSHQLKSYVASKSRLKLAARAVLSADAGLLVDIWGTSVPTPFTDQGQICCATADLRSTFKGQISSECVLCVCFRWPKTQFWANFDILGGSCTDPILPMRAKFALLEQTQGLHWQATFHLNVFIVSASCGKKTQFWAIFDIFGDSCTDPLLPMRAKLGALQQMQVLHLQAKFHLNMFIVSASGGQKPQFWANFDIFGGFCTDPLLSMRAKFGAL